MNTKDKNSINKPMSQKKYVESVSKEFNDWTICMCPFCKSADITWEVMKLAEVNQRNQCNSCSAIWEDNYRVVGYTVIRKPAKDC
jgi:hypothetical protein